MHAFWQSEYTCDAIETSDLLLLMLTIIWFDSNFRGLATLGVDTTIVSTGSVKIKNSLGV